MKQGLHPVVMIALVAAVTLFGRVLPTWTLSLATIAASSVENPHSLDDVAAEQLIEEVNVDGAELVLKRRHDRFRMIRRWCFEGAR